MAAKLRVPTAVSSITFATSGAIVPDGSSNITGITNAELLSCFNGIGEWNAFKISSTTLASGLMVLYCPPLITSITVNGHVYAAVAGFINNVAAVDATILATQPFQLVIGS